MSVRAEAPHPHYARGQIVTARRLAILGMGLAPVALWLTLPPLTLDTVAAPLILGAVSALLGVAAITRGERRVGWGAVASGLLAIGAGVFAVQASSSNLKEGHHLVNADLARARGRHPPRLRSHRRDVLGAEWRGEHRSRGHDADGRLLRDLGRRRDGIVVRRAADRDGLGRATRPRPRVLGCKLRADRSSSARRSSSWLGGSPGTSTTTSTSSPEERQPSCPRSRS